MRKFVPAGRQLLSFACPAARAGICRLSFNSGRTSRLGPQDDIHSASLLTDRARKASVEARKPAAVAKARATRAARRATAAGAAQ